MTRAEDAPNYLCSCAVHPIPLVIRVVQVYTIVPSGSNVRYPRLRLVVRCCSLGVTKFTIFISSPIHTTSASVFHSFVVSPADYSEHLPCYRDILRNGTLGLCDDIWQMLHPMLNNVSAYQFYCQPDTPDSTLLQK